MRRPQVIVVGLPGELAGWVRDRAAAGRWVVRECADCAAAGRVEVRGRPTVAVVGADPADPGHAALARVADWHAARPDVAAVVVGAAKLPADAQAGWVAAVLDLGARVVLLPPVARPTLDDVITGLMAVAAGRAGVTADAPIDLAAGGYEDDS